jgi:hypothetical protein
MNKAGAIILLFMIFFPVLLTAQQEDDDGWDYYYDEGFANGDQTFIISLGTVFPIGFPNNKIDPPVGGTGSLAYNYYLTPHVFIGAEVSGMFLPTLGGNVLYIIPIGIRGGYQFNIWRLEFPLNLTFGMVWHSHLDNGYFGIYAKAGGSAFFRATYTWSFGLNANFYWFPEWIINDPSKNHDGFFIDLTLSARYHF